jgi:hypothetical protein
MNIHIANSIGADMFISWIGEADQIRRINIRTLGGLHGIAYLKRQLGAPILLAQL